nr:MAG TPA: hypothetical protein [Caudoviricetes sp.]
MSIPIKQYSILKNRNMTTKDFKIQVFGHPQFGENEHSYKTIFNFKK